MSAMELPVGVDVAVSRRAGDRGNWMTVTGDGWRARFDVNGLGPNVDDVLVDMHQVRRWVWGYRLTVRTVAGRDVLHLTGTVRGPSPLRRARIVRAMLALHDMDLSGAVAAVHGGRGATAAGGHARRLWGRVGANPRELAAWVGLWFALVGVWPVAHPDHAAQGGWWVADLIVHAVGGFVCVGLLLDSMMNRRQR